MKSNRLRSLLCTFAFFAAGGVSLAANSYTLMGMGSNASNELLQGAPDKHSPVQVLSAVNVKEVAAGGSHTLFLTTDGQLYGMGSNYCGQLGTGAGISFAQNGRTSVPIHIADNVKAVAAAGSFSFYVTSGGVLYGMGENRDGQLGVGRTSKAEFVPAKIATNVKRVVAGSSYFGGCYAMFITDGGDLYVMGANAKGQLGTGNKVTVLTPIRIAVGVADVAAGGNVSYYVTSSGVLYGMGERSSLGLAGASPYDALEVVPVRIADHVLSVFSRGSTSMYLTAVGYLYAWGSNSYGQYGQGGQDGYGVPTKISIGSKKVKGVSMGAMHTLVLTVDGDLYSMGYNSSGQLGNGDYAMDHSYNASKIASNVVKIACGEYHSMYVRDDGRLFAMGANGSGQLGDGSTVFCAEPVTVRDGVAMAAAGYYMAFFLTPDGVLYKMGADGSPAQRVASNVRTVSSFCSSSHALYITNDNKLFGLGSNQDGELGASASNPTETPVLLATGVAACAVGGSSSYYISTTGDLYGMGSGEYGELGGGVATSTSQPRKIASNVKAAAAGTVSCVFLTNDGALYGCGDPESLGCDLSQYARQAISNQYGTQVLASPVLLDTNVSAIAAGWFHVLYLKGNTLYGRGAQDGGQLGNGVPVVDWDTYVSASYDGYSFALAPVRIATNVVAMAGGEDSTFYITQDGKLYATGMQSCGELGDGTIMARSTPVQVASGVASVVAGKHTTLFLSGGAQSLVIRDEPSSQSVAAGGTTVLSVTVSGAAAPTYQWQISTNGGASWSDVSSGAGYSGGTTARLSIAGVTKSMNGYQYRCVISDGANPSISSAAATLSVGWSQFAALSARAPAGTGDQTLILGFVFAGGGKPTLVRGVGPNMSATVSGYMRDPQVTLYALGGAEVARNDNWVDTSALRTAFAQTGAAALGANSKDAALLESLTGNVYTAHVSGVNGTTGVALAEAFDANLSDKTKRLTALSVRNQVGTGENILIAGFVIDGDAPKRVIVRGVGPGMAATVSSYLRDPYLQVWKGNQLIAENDDWDHTAETAALFDSVGMKPPLGSNSKDAALVLTLEPGLYTALVSGVGGTTGVGLVEIYEAP